MLVEMLERFICWLAVLTNENRTMMCLIALCLCLYLVEHLLFSHKKLERNVANRYDEDDCCKEKEVKLTTMKELPTMPGLPMFGSFFSLGKHPHVTLARVAKEKYENKIFIVKSGQRKFVVFTDYEDMQYLIKKYPEQLFGKPKSFTTAQVTVGAHNDVVRRWKKRRAYTNAGLKFIEVSSLNDIISEEIEEMVEKFGEMFSEGSEKFPADIRHEVTYAISKIMHRIAYGNALSEDTKKKLLEIVHKLPDYTTSMGSFCTFDALPFLSKFMKDKFSKFINFNHILRDFCSEEKQTCLSNENNPDHPSNLLLFFKKKLDNIRHLDKACYNDLHSVIYEGLEDIVRAGTESTSLTVQWFLLYVSKYTKVQKKMQDEIDALLKRKRADKLVLDFYNELPYGQAVVAETLRFCSINPFLKRELTGDVITKDGVLLPKGTCLIFNNYALNFDETFWQEPSEFKPERFLDENGQMNSQVLDRLMTFGFGKRRCIGVHAGRSICHFSAVSLVERFNIKSASSDVDIESVNGIGLSPKPFKVVLETRLKKDRDDVLE